MRPSCFNCIHRIPDMNTCFDGDGVPYRWICELTRCSASDPSPCRDYERVEEEEKNKK